MLTRAYHIIILAILISACDKKPIDISTPASTQIIVNGRFTDSLDYQTFNVTFSSPIQGQQYTPIETAKIQIEHDNTVFTFSYLDSGKYQSDLPFAGQYGDNYKVKIEVNEIEAECQTVMPSPILINDLIIDRDTLSSFTNLTLNINSPVDQYFIFKQYEGLEDSLGVDTIWTEQLAGISNIYPVYVGQNEISLFNEFEYFISDTNLILKIDVFSISPDVADYLNKLNQYSKNQSTTNLFVNPPHFYANGVYGLTYGTTTTSIIKAL